CQTFRRPGVQKMPVCVPSDPLPQFQPFVYTTGLLRAGIVRTRLNLPAGRSKQVAIVPVASGRTGYMHRFMIFVLGMIAALVIFPLAGMQFSRAPPAYAHAAFQQTRDELDLPIDAGQANHTWFWGPEPITEGIYEPYAE